MRNDSADETWNTLVRKSAVAATLIVFGFLASSNSAVAAETILLGQAANFTILGGTTVTNTGATIITGNVGLSSPGVSVTGFPPGVVMNGAIHIGDALANQAHADAFTAYTQLVGEMPTMNLSGVDLGTLTLMPGVYHFDTSAQLTGTLRLDTGGDPNAAFHFQIGTTLTTGTNAAVVLLGLGGASDPNIFWQVGTSATIGMGTSFNGNIVALTSITVVAGVNFVDGRALAINGAVTMDTNTINGVAAPIPAGRFWNGNASNLWSGVNWSPDTSGATLTTLASDVDVVFSVTGIVPQNQNTTLDVDATISSLTVDDLVTVTISGAHTLSINGAGATSGITINNGAGLTTINSDLALSGLSQIMTVNNAAGLVINGVVSGTIGLTKLGPGRLTLTAAEIYTDSTLITAGILQLGNGIIAGTSIAPSGPVTINNGATLALNLVGGETFGNAVTDNGLVTTIASGTNTLSGVMSGTGAFTQNGSGVSILTGANTFNGATTVLQGTLQIGNGTAGSILAASPVTVTAGTLAIDMVDGGTFSNNVADNALVTTIASGTNTLPGVISGTGAFTQNGIGLSVLTGANTYSGATTVLQGTLQIGNGTAGSILAASPVTVIAGTLAIDLFDGGIFPNNVTDNALVTTIASGTNTLSGVVDGTGAFTQNGIGLSILTGANTYSGATTVLHGTLQIGNGTAGSILAASPVTVTDGTLAIDLANGGIFSNNVANHSLITAIASGTNTLSGVMSGTGAFTQSGTGLTIITGTNLYTGLTTVLAGALEVDGSIAGDALVSGGILQGVGNIEGNVINNAVVSPGGVISPGTLHIGSPIPAPLVSRRQLSSPAALTGGGNYTQNASGTLTIRLASTSIYDRLAIGGGAALNGALIVSYLGGFNAVPGDVFTIITTGSGVSGTFSSFSDPHATGTLLTLQVVYQPNNVLLQFVQGPFTLAVPRDDCHSNELAVARTLDKLAVENPAHPLVVELGPLPLPEILSALSILSPSDLTSIFTAGLAVSQIQVGNLERRLDEVRRGATGFSDSGYAVVDRRSTRDDDGKNVISRNEGSGRELVAPSIQSDRHWGFFISGTGELIDVDCTCAARGSSFTTGGVTVGADYRVGSQLVLGVAIGYANTSSDLSRDGDLDIDSGKVSLYGTFYNQGFYVNGIVGGGLGSIDTRRTTVGGFARGQTDGTDFNGLLGVGYDYHIGGFTVGPVASMQYATVEIDRFSETGALGALRIDSQSQASLKSAVGLKASYAKKVGGIVFAPEVRAQWQHEYRTSTSSIDASFTSTTAFTVHGPRIGRDGLLADVGASVQLSSNVAFFAYYTGELGRENYSAHSINGGLSFSF